MRRNIQVVFVISALVILILCSGCTSQPQAGNTSQQGGLNQVTVPVKTPRIGFEEAQQKLVQYRTASMHESGNVKTIYYFQAGDMDASGKAASWVFGVKNTTTAELLVYSGTGWRVIPWIITPLPQEILTDRIVPPGNLFAQNQAIIIGDSSRAPAERRDLELKDGVYTVTITSGNSPRILTFNASTGALIA